MKAHHAAVNRMVQTFFCTVACWIALLLPFVPIPSHSMTASQPERSFPVRVYLNPNTGRFWTMDSHEGSQEDPLSLHKYLYCQDNPIDGTDPSGHEDMISISVASQISTELHGNYDSGVTTAGNSLKNTIIGVFAGMSVEQIVVLNILDNAGGVILGKAVGSLSQLRKLPGIVSGVGKVIQGDRWLRGSQGNAGFIPEQVAAKLAGQKFANFDKFRAAFWNAVGKDSELASGFSSQNVARMKQGNAPYASTTQQVGGRVTYELHHSTPIQQGGDVYNVDNLIVCTPRYHQDVLYPAYHY